MEAERGERERVQRELVAAAGNKEEVERVLTEEVHDNHTHLTPHTSHYTRIYIRYT